LGVEIIPVLREQAACGPKLTIELDHGGVKRVIDSFVAESEDPRPLD
jgi:hypothetical protein